MILPSYNIFDKHKIVRSELQSLLKLSLTGGMAKERMMLGFCNLDKDSMESSACIKALVINSFKHSTALIEFSSYLKS